MGSRTSWTEAAEGVVDRLGSSMQALWALLHGAGHAALVLALDEQPGDDTLTRVGIDLADALGELEWVRPDLPRYAITLDLRPDPGADPAQRRDQLAAVLTVTTRLTNALATDAGDEHLDTTDLLAVGRISALVHTATTTLHQVPTR